MAKNWYPIIDYKKCTGCRQCFNFCPHGVFEIDKAGKLEVTRPENCVESCKGCGKICEQKAITFFSDSTRAESRDKKEVNKWPKKV